MYAYPGTCTIYVDYVKDPIIENGKVKCILLGKGNVQIKEMLKNAARRSYREYTIVSERKDAPELPGP